MLASGRAQAGAPTPTSSAEAAHAPEPNVVALWIDGSLPPERRSALERVVRAEIAEDAVTLEVAQAHTPLSLWIREVARERRVLIAAALQSDEVGWRLYLLHVARGRTMERRLPGGADADAAALEAVATILESAISALHDGLELGEPGTPLAADTGSAAAPPARETSRPSPVAPDRPRGEVSDEPRAWAVLGGVGASVAALGSELVAGGNASLALRTGSRLGLRLGAALYLPKEVKSPYGDFRFQRSMLELGVQALLPAHPFTLLPELGAGVELVRRSDAAPGPGVVASSDASHLRVGDLVGLRLSYPVSRLVALELGVRVECFTRALHFLAAGAPSQQLLSLEPFVPAAALGLVLGRP